MKATVADLAGNQVGPITPWTWNAPLWVKLPMLAGQYPSLALGTDDRPLILNAVEQDAIGSMDFILQLARLGPTRAWDTSAPSPQGARPASRVSSKAALAVGTSHAVLDYVIPYVKEREAFGEPIAHRQSVAFMCANIAIELDGLRMITWRGAARAEQGLSFAREAALAKKLGTDKGMQIGLDGVQLLGGHGYTKEHPVERWYRDLRALGVAEGVVVL